MYKQNKQSFGLFVEDKKQKAEKNRQKRLENQAIRNEAKQIELESKMEVKATPVYNDSNTVDINYKKPIITEPKVEPIEIERTKKNTLYEDYFSDRPDLRDYYQ